MQKLIIIFSFLILNNLHCLSAAPSDEKCRILLRKVIKKATFNLDRGADKYLQYLENIPEFKRRFIAVLRSGGHIIDSGCGHCIFARDFYQGKLPQEYTTSHAKYTGITLDLSPHYADRFDQQPSSATETKVTFGNRIQILHNRYFEDIPDSDIESPYGKADIILDIVGVVSYTEALGTVLNRYFHLLKPDGEIYLVMTDDRNTMIKVPDEYLTPKEQLIYYGGMPLHKWLKRVPGLSSQVVSFDVSYSVGYDVIRLTRKDPQKDPKFPNLNLVSVEDFFTPPKRTFSESK